MLAWKRTQKNDDDDDDDDADDDVMFTGTPLNNVKDSKSGVDLNNNSNNNYDHLEHHSTYTNNNIQIINNNNNNSLQSPLFALHPSVRNHSTTVPGFHPYRR